MALAYAQSVGDGSTRTFTIPFPYISKTHVQVKVDGNIVPFTWMSETSVQVTVAPAVGAIVDRRRVTPRDTLLVDFVDGSTLVETDLDLSALQVFYLSQEAFDLGESSLGVADDGSFSALGRRIKEVLDPVDLHDVANKRFVETGMTSQVAIATAKAGEASASKIAAALSEGSAAASAASALASKNASGISEANASSSASSASGSATVATSQAGIATTKAGEASTSRDTAVTKAGEASTAASSASSNATLAQKWASNPEDSEVTSGLFSAYHWYRKTLALYTAVANGLAGWIHAASVKALPDDTDELGLVDGAAGWLLKKLTMVRLKAYVAKEGFTSPLRNKIINGNFDVWQRGVSQTVSNIGPEDRFSNTHSGDTKTTSRQAFPAGQTDVPDNPKFFSRTVITAVAGAGSYVQKVQRIEGVETLSGKLATLTFYAKSSVAKNISVEFAQVFGTGGSPSANVDTIGVTTYSLTTAWQKFTALVNLPSIAGKTLGSNGDDHLALIFWLDAGSTYATRSGGIGQLSATVDIARVSLVEGDARNEADPFSPRGFVTEMQLCMRYYEQGYGIFSGNVTSGLAYYHSSIMRVTKRAIPSVVTTDVSNASFAGGSPGVIQFQTAVRASKLANITGAGYFEYTWAADAEL